MARSSCLTDQPTTFFFFKSSPRSPSANTRFYRGGGGKKKGSQTLDLQRHDLCQSTCSRNQRGSCHRTALSLAFYFPGRADRKRASRRLRLILTSQLIELCCHGLIEERGTRSTCGRPIGYRTRSISMVHQLTCFGRLRDVSLDRCLQSFFFFFFPLPRSLYRFMRAVYEM